MALSYKVGLKTNKMTNLMIALALLVNLNKVTFDEWCEYLAQGSSLDSNECAAVLKQISKKLPTLLSTNSYVEWNGMGGVIRPTISGSITAAEWKAKQMAGGKEEEECTELTTSALKTSMLTPGISITLGKKVVDNFHPELTRVRKEAVTNTEESEGSSEDTDSREEVE